MKDANIKPREKILRPRRGWKDNIKMYLKGSTVWGFGVDVYGKRYALLATSCERSGVTTTILLCARST
jgi:hypothetical protein